MRAFFLWRQNSFRGKDRGTTSKNLEKVSPEVKTGCSTLEKVSPRETNPSAPLDSPGLQPKMSEAKSGRKALKTELGLSPFICLTGVVAALALVLVCAGALVDRVHAEAKPAVQLSVDKATPREVDDTVQQAIARDYASAWQALASALSNNNVAALNDNFVGFAQDKLTRRIHDQQQAGLKTRIVDRGHKVDAIFYSKDGAAIELRDTATIETEILEGGTVIHSDQSQVHFCVVMTGAEDRWKVRVLESVKSD
jgi:hypothetical protein